MAKSTVPIPVPRKHVALVVAGAVARGAYEAGALAQLLPALEARGERPRILMGTSSGALNAAFLASRAHLSATDATSELLDLWKNIDPESVFRFGPLKMLGAIGRARRGLVVTKPLERTIREALGEPDQIAANLRRGKLDALAVVATPAGTCRSTVFVQKRASLGLPSQDDRKGIDYEEPTSGITVDHLMASAAVPVAFPPVRIDGRWFVDGGVRLNAPIKPALKLGADAVAIVATNPAFPPPPDPAVSRRRPDWDDNTLQFMQAAIADPLIEDMDRLARINQLVLANRGEWKGVKLRDEHRTMMPIPYLFVGPPYRGELGTVAAAALPRCRPQLLQFVSAIVGTQGVQHKELLSYLMFDSEFAARAIELGRSHASEELGALTTHDVWWRMGPIEPRSDATHRSEELRQTSAP
jgi:NTE family protein